MSSSSGNLATTTGFVLKAHITKTKIIRKETAAKKCGKLGSSRTGVIDSEDPRKLSSSQQLLDASNHPDEDRGVPPPPAGSGTGGAEQFCGGGGDKRTVGRELVQQE